MWKRHHVSIWVYTVILFSIIMGYAILDFYCVHQSAKERTYAFTEGTFDVPQNGMTILMSVPTDKEWDDEEHHPDLPHGAQYDFVLGNDCKFTFREWKATIVFSDTLYIDSSWNGIYTQSGNAVSMIAIKDTATVSPHGTGTFGAIIYGEERLSLKSFTVTGYLVYHVTDFAVFWILSVFLALWAISMGLHTIVEIRTARYRQRQELDSQIIKQSINTFIGFIDAKDSYTKGHSARVAAYAAEIARRMKLPKEQVGQLYYITLMHDCGKIGVPDSILKKPGKLTSEEYEVIKSHTTMGDAVLVNFTAIPGIRDGAHYHHERYDGTGYPVGLKGNDIPLCARIICVADSYDAMSRNRCYRRHLSSEQILGELLANAGKQFDPTIVPYMVSMIQDGFTDSVQAKYPAAVATLDAEKSQA